MRMKRHYGRTSALYAPLVRGLASNLRRSYRERDEDDVDYRYPKRNSRPVNLRIQHAKNDHKGRANHSFVDLKAQVDPGFEVAVRLQDHFEGGHEEGEEDEEHECREGAVARSQSYGGACLVTLVSVPVVLSIMVSGVLHHVYGKDGNEKEDGEKVCGP